MHPSACTQCKAANLKPKCDDAFAICLCEFFNLQNMLKLSTKVLHISLKLILTFAGRLSLLECVRASYRLWGDAFVCVCAGVRVCVMCVFVCVIIHSLHSTPSHTNHANMQEQVVGLN